MREVHEGICGNHSGSQSLVHKLIRAGYYWPTMQKDAQAYVRACDKCQRFNNIIRQPTKELTPMMVPWPFTQWGLDIIGPFPTTIRQLKFLVVGIDYLTKWVEVKALATSWRKMYEASSRGTSSTGTRSLESWSRTTGSSSTMSHSRIFSHNWGSRIMTPHPPTLRPTNKLRSRTDPCLKLSRLDSRREMVYGQMSYQVYCGCTRRRPEHLQEKHPFD